jgi:hypothetical protein
MGKLFDQIDQRLEEFIRAQQMFFVATAPLDATGHVNVSPKGLDTLRVLDPQTLAYLDQVGSGAETIAHLRENGRIVLMLCAFQGAPRIVRFHGRGSVIEPQDQEFNRLRSVFPAEPAGRAIIHIAIDRIADSCGFGVHSTHSRSIDRRCQTGRRGRGRTDSANTRYGRTESALTAFKRCDGPKRLSPAAIVRRRTL